MPAAMEKRKKNQVFETAVGGESLGPTKKVFKTRALTKKKAKAKLKALADGGEGGGGVAVVDRSAVQWRPRAEQAEWFTSTFHSVFGALLSPAEKEPLPDERIVELSEEIDRSTEKLGSRVKAVIGPVWKESLCNVDKTGDAGSPVVLVLCSSAIRCVELLRGMKAFIGKVKPAKLFAKHIKVEEQVTLLKEHVNIAAGTPNRVRKLIDIGAMGTERLRLVILDMHADAKGLTILSVPQVMAEFWELYRAHFHQVQAKSIVESYKVGIKYFYDPVDPTEMVDIQAWWQSAVCWCVGLGKAQIDIATGDGEKIKLLVAKAGLFVLSITLYVSVIKQCAMAPCHFAEYNSGLVNRS